MKLEEKDIMKELENVLLEYEKPSIYFQELRENNDLLPYFKELKMLIGVKQSPIYHAEGDVWNHTMMVIDEASKIKSQAKYPFYFMLSALCHDFGKSITTTVKNSRIISYNHEREGLVLVSNFLDRIKADKNLKEYVLNMTKFHMQPNQLAKQCAKSKSTRKLFDNSICPEDLVLIAKADGLGRISGDGDNLADYDFNQNYLKKALEKFKSEKEK